jgi:stage V sporulation protein B
VAVFSFTNIIDNIMVKSRLAASNAFDAQGIDSLYGQLTGKYVTLTTLPVSIATAFATVAVPNIAATAHFKNKLTSLRAKVNNILKLTMIISIPAAVGLGVLGEPILLFLFPNAPMGAELLSIGCASIVFLSLSQILTGLIQGLGYVMAPAVFAIISVIIKIPINYFLIAVPGINIMGAVFSTTVSYLIASVLNLIFLSRIIKSIPDLVSSFLKPFIASCIMGACAFLLYKFSNLYMNNGLALSISMIASMSVYVIVLYLIGGINMEDVVGILRKNKDI